MTESDKALTRVDATGSRPGTSRRSADEEILVWTTRIGAVTVDALACLQQTSSTTASRRLAAAARERLLSRRHLLVGWPALYTATATGMRRSGIEGLGLSRVSVANAPHTIACARAAAALQRLYPDHHVTGERELRRDERNAGAPLASAVLDRAAGHRTRLHRPDLVLWPQPASGGAPIAIEVELAVKAPRRLVEICRAWARSREVAGVVYLASAPAQRALARAIEQASAHERIGVLPLDALSALLD
jgi:hypothetical protein